ncbi:MULTISPECIES: hypothetical protein [Burkholderia]|uniref:hypothetical protein n=1 Tax=Burkholderia TaxID=32008 RepID=UPI0012DE0AF2|nr:MULTISPECIES: hypothetical protein [Burkholderia]MBX3803139.1 hypothetical protein [Burkholderia cepacia]MBX3925437.1 hypothetical protein [Burkholderia cepacia]MBX3941418.1 hypothetical protein [Burkholderia cepacia]MBX3959717.1 hypothetical protein [Burkholderia cepacia]MBX3980311.1 hypothetical protein [Burkholderia cepacia]
MTRLFDNFFRSVHPRSCFGSSFRLLNRGRSEGDWEIRVVGELAEPEQKGIDVSFDHDGVVTCGE